MANVRARQAAATGKERPKKVVCGEEKKSMSLPIVRGMSMETDDETRSCDKRPEKHSADQDSAGIKRVSEGQGGLTSPTAKVKLRFSGLASSTNFLIEADEVSLGNNLDINVFLPEAAGVATSVVDDDDGDEDGEADDKVVAGDEAESASILVERVSFGVEGTGSEGFKVNSPCPTPFPDSRSISFPTTSFSRLIRSSSFRLVDFAREVECSQRRVIPRVCDSRVFELSGGRIGIRELVGDSRVDWDRAVIRVFVEYARLDGGKSHLV